MRCSYCSQKILNDAAECEGCSSSLEQTEGFKGAILPGIRSKNRDWKLRTAIAVPILLLVLVLSGCGGEQELVFCESVDEDLNPVNPGSVFTTGEIKMVLQSSSSLDTSSVQISMYQVHNGHEEIMDSVQEQINPEWDTFYYPLTFFDPGKYKILVSEADGDVIVENTVRIE